MANEVRIRASVDDKVSGSLTRMRDKFDNLGKSGGFKALVQGVGMGAGMSAYNLMLGAVTGVTNAIGDSISAAIAEEASIAKLGTALKANIPNWNGNTDAIEKTLSARMKLGFADDEQRESLALLVAATNDSAKALDLQRTAMDLARLKGISLADASAALIKVEGGQFRLLKSLGIELKDNATQTEALAAVQKAAEGQAAAYAETTGGKLLVAQTQIGEAMEKFGTAILPAVAEGLTSVSNALDRTSMDLADVATAAANGSQAAQAHLNQMAETTKTATQDMVSTVEGAQGPMAKASKDFAGEVPKALKVSKSKALDLTSEMTEGIVDEVRQHRDNWQGAWSQYKDDLDNEMSKAAQIAKLKGILASKRLAEGLKSKDPLVKASAEHVREVAQEELDRLRGKTHGYGAGATKNYAKGLTSQKWRVDSAVKLIAGSIRNGFRIASPAKEGPLSDPGGPAGYGEKLVSEYARGIASGLGKVRRATHSVAGAARLSGSIGAMGAGGGGGGATINLVVNPPATWTPAAGQAFAREAGPYLRDYLNRRG